MKSQNSEGETLDRSTTHIPMHAWSKTMGLAQCKVSGSAHARGDCVEREEWEGGRDEGDKSCSERGEQVEPTGSVVGLEPG